MGRCLFQLRFGAAAAEDGVEHSTPRMRVAADDDVVEHRQVAEQPARLEGACDAAFDDCMRREAVEAPPFQAHLA